MRLLICAGGTGGGVYPALAVHNMLTSQRTNVQTLWVGGEGGLEAALVQRAAIPFETIPAAGVHGVGLKRLPRNLWQLGRGLYAAQRILRRFKPDVLLFTGGYVAVPMALAGRRIPSLLYVPDIEPGLALKAISRFSRCIAVTAKSTRRFFPRRRVVHTGYPVRAGLDKLSKEAARITMRVAANLPVLLVVGGSKGARSINRAVLENLPTLLVLAQVIHISGELDWPIVEASRQALPADLAARYHAIPYLHEEMGAALAAADLVISRAGASVLGEFPNFSLPAVLVPYPHAWRYQKVNADYLAERGAAVVLEDSSLKSQLAPTVKMLLDNPAKLNSMRAAMKQLAHPQAAGEIAKLLIALTGTRR